MFAFDFLSADIPLTKSFTKTDQGIQTTSYPMVRNFTSHREQAENLDELLDLLTTHAEQGHVVLKGLLKQPIVNNSRAGLTTPNEETRWLLLDLDFTDGWDSVEDFVDQLDPALQDVSFIFQHSASAGVTSKAGLRGHIFILLDRPVSPSYLKAWLRWRNLNIPELSDQIRLTASGFGLTWPLDITTCQNDKLIYIAPPICEGIDDPLAGQRFRLVRRTKHVAQPPALDPQAIALLDTTIRKTVNEKRAALDLPKRTARFRTVKSYEVLSNPMQATVTGVKVERGFTYLNLNGGDSWGYFFPSDNPQFLFNFKDEPIVELKKLAPEFYAEYTAQLNEIKRANEEAEAATREKELRAQTEQQGFTPLVFRDPRRDTYYNARYYKNEDRIEVASASTTTKLEHFMRQYGWPAPEFIEDWTVEFKPTENRVIDMEKRWINSFSPTRYMRGSEGESTPQHPPAMIHRIIQSICAGDEESIGRFYNWLAYIFQTRRKSGTSWIFHGVSGTGKGLLVSKVLKPLFGPDHVVEFTASNLEDQFNAPLERALILWLDEMHLDNARQTSTVMNKLKNYITEERISIRGMRQNAFSAPSYLNVIIATNHPDPVRLASHDRRFNVPPAQEQPLKVTTADIDQIRTELDTFAAYLRAYDVNEQHVREVMQNEARANMIVASQTTIERMFEAFNAGDLEFFMSFAGGVAPLQDTVIHANYEKLVTDWCRAALKNETVGVSFHDMRQAYLYIIGGTMTPAKFSRMAAIHRIRRETVYSGGRPTTGTHVVWRASEDQIRAFLDYTPELKAIK